MSFSSEYQKLRKKRLEEESKGTTKNTSKGTAKSTTKKSSNSSFTDEYLALRAERMSSLEEKSSILERRDDDIAPVRTSFVKGGDKDSVFKSGGFSDGVDGVGDFLGDLGETVLGTVGDLGIGIVKGAGRLIEGVADLGIYGAAGITDLFGGDDETVESIKRVAKKNYVDDLTEGLEGYVDQYSVLGDKADMVSEGLGQVASIIVTGGLGAAGGLGTAGVTALTTGITGLSGMGSGIGEAYAGGATDEEAWKYGLTKGTIEAGTELLFGGLGKASKAIGIGKSAIPLDDILAKAATKKITSQTAKNLVQYGIKASAEGVEEVIAGYLSAHAKKGTYMPEKDFSEILEDEKLLESFIVGTVTSAISQSGIVPAMYNGSVIEANKEGRDFITGYTQNEQKVIDKEVERRVAEREKNGTKLTKKEIGKIEERVQADLDKGYISTDTIEEVLGGETYKSYKDAVDNEEALQKEFDTLNKMKQGEMTGEQIDRRTELKQQLEELKSNSNKGSLKTKLSDEVFSLVKDSRLVESYNEKARKGQAFEADLTQYTGKQKEAVERAIKSGVLNNTNRSHELVNILSKIEAEKGIVFDYANNKKLQETGFAIEGKTVNGFANKSTGTVTLNVQSSKAWQSTVGHEITHILEGTDAYTELRSALFEFAESKGELESRRTALTELYKNIDADIDAELTADLVGDYLFSDTDFINRLTGNRTLFQKIYDEIKYLCKVATGKELTEIEKVREKFDKVWKAVPTEGINEELNDKVNYSVSADNEGNQLSKEQSEFFKDSKARDEKGNLLAVYHGSKAEGFNTFEYSPTKQTGTDFGEAYYFTSDYEKASGYSYDVTKDVRVQKYQEERRKRLDRFLETKSEADKQAFLNVKVDGKNLHELMNDEKYTTGGEVKKVYLNLTNPLIIDAGGKYYYEVYEQYFKEAKENGKDGIIVKNVIDNPRGEHRPIDVYIAFKNNQIKNVDNTNPTADADIRYSVSEDIQKTDSVYLKIAESGNTEIAQKMVDEAAKKAGYGIKAYHGTGFDFTVFDKSKQGDNYQDWGRLGKGFYFAPTSREAETWAELSKGAKNKVMPVYLRSENMLDSFEPLPDNLKDTIPENWDSLTRRLAEKYAYNYIEYMQEFGYNVQEILTQKGYDGINGHTEFVVFDPEQVKSADAITYDDKGNVIPLSQRFNTANEDIRYSISEDVLENNRKILYNNSPLAIENNKNYAEGENSANQNTELLAGREVSAVSGSGNSVWQHSGNSAKLAGYLGTNSEFEGKVPEGCRAGESGWVLQKDNTQSGQAGHTISLLRRISRVVPSGKDTIGRRISSETSEKFVNTVFKDEGGNLLSLYHWTTEEFEEFTKGEFGFHFGTLEAAHDRYSAVKEENADTPRGNYKEVFLNITNPIELSDNLGEWEAGWVAQQLVDMGVITEHQYDLLSLTTGFYETTYDNPAAEAVRDILERNGYDGIIYRNETEDVGSFSVIALHPEQILTVAENGVLKENSGVRDNTNEIAPIKEASSTNDVFFDEKNPKYSLSAEKDTKNTDSEYMLAVKNGDMETAQKLVNEAAEKAGYTTNEDYKISHYAPVAQIDKEYFTDLDKLQELCDEGDDLNLFAVANGISLQPDDYFGPNGARWYMYDDADGMESYRAIKPAMDSIQQQMQQYGEVREMPTIKVYRAVPKSLKETKLQSGGQWVTPSYRYAVKHGNNALNGKYKIIEETVSAENLWWDGNDIREWGFDDGTNYAYRDTKNNRKLLDAVTYDDEGNVIPLSKRFNYRNADERFSLSKEGEQPSTVGTPLNETALEQDIAPVKETAPMRVTNPKSAVVADAGNEQPTIPKSTQLIDGTRGDNLLNESLDNYPMETVEQKVAEKIRAVEGELADNRDLRREAETNYNNQIAELRERYEAKKNKNTKVANHILQSISRLERLKASVDADFAKRISDLEARAERMKTPKYGRAMQKQAKMQEHAKWAADLLGDTSTWVDKKIGLQYATNTERRNLRDIVRDENGNVDIARADAIDDALNGQYNREEAAKKRELAKARGKYADLKITKAEDTYIQMLGELRHNPETSLTEKVVNEYYEKHKDKIDTAKVEKVIDLARQDYDSFLNRVNEKLREQGMKEIPYRQGYFPHFTEPKQNFIQRLLNWKTQDNEIPTSIAGLTETFKPVKSWQSFDKTRHSDETDYSFTKGFDTYSQGVLDWIYHLDTLQKRRAVENHIRYTHSDEGIQARIKEVYANEELDANEAQAQIEHILAEAKNPLNNFVQDFTTHTNILAGKKNSLDRTVEQATNRHIYSVMTNVQSRLSANMVLANVRSALTNFIPITQSWAQVSPMRSLQATKDTIANAIKNDGMIDKSTFLTNRLREVDNLYQTNWDKVLDKAGIMFEIVDNFSSQVIWRSKYNQNIANGMSESQAIANADQFAENVMAGRSKGNEPTLFNAKNPLVKAFTVFQLEVNNQYGYLFKDVPNDLKAETNHWKLNLAKGYTTAFIGAYIYNALLEQVAGSGAALDPISIIEDLLRDLGLFDDDEEKEPDEVVTNLIKNVGEELPFVGGVLFGGGRIPISSALPYSDNGLIDGIGTFAEDVSEGNWANVGKEMMAPILNIGLPVGGGQIKKTVQGLGMFSDEHPIAGSYTDSGKLRFPVEDTLGNRIQAGIFGQWANENARDYIENGRTPLNEKQTQEFIDVDLPIADYWKYREGLKGLKTTEEKFDYIDSLDLPVSKKNILANNVTDRKEPVDLENYDDYSSLEEFDYATKNPEKYAFAKSVGGYSAYKTYSDELYDIKADKDSSGKSISGSRKEKVVEYINNLDADYEIKIILFKSEYPSDDTYNQDIINYLNNREDLTYDERVAIYTELGFRVSDGYVYWD